MTANVLIPGAQQPTGTMVPGGLQTAFVTIRNEGDEVFSMKYGPRDRLTIPVGSQVTVVEEVAWHYMGRWWMDNNNKNRDRVREYDRLRVLYGAYEDDSEWERARPRLGVYDNNGERVLTVVDDPTGDLGPVRATAFSKQMSMEGQLAAMAARQEELELQITRLRAQSVNEAQPTVGTDPAPQAPYNPAPAPQPLMADLGAAGHVPVAPPMIPNSTDGAIEVPEEAEVIFGERLEVVPVPIPVEEVTGMPPVDEPQRAKLKTRG